MAFDTMQKIYSSTALASKQREVKDAANQGVVHITENGNGAYIFCSEEIFAAEIEHAREEARYEAEALFLLRRAQTEVAEGHVTDIAGLKKAIAGSVVANG